MPETAASQQCSQWVVPGHSPCIPPECIATQKAPAAAFTSENTGTKITAWKHTFFLSYCMAARECLPGKSDLSSAPCLERRASKPTACTAEERDRAIARAEYQWGGGTFFMLFFCRAAAENGFQGSACQAQLVRGPHSNPLATCKRGKVSDPELLKYVISWPRNEKYHEARWWNGTHISHFWGRSLSFALDYDGISHLEQEGQ